MALSGIGSPLVPSSFNSEAGALGFRDFLGLPVAKENRNDSHRTLHTLSP
jgi:hypothetical protein